MHAFPDTQLQAAPLNACITWEEAVCKSAPICDGDKDDKPKKSVSADADGANSDKDKDDESQSADAEGANSDSHSGFGTVVSTKAVPQQASPWTGIDADRYRRFFELHRVFEAESDSSSDSSNGAYLEACAWLKRCMVNATKIVR